MGDCERDDSGRKIILSAVKENRLIRFVAITLLVYLFFRFVFPLMAPFIAAFILITLFYPLLQRIQKKIPMRKKFLAFGVLFLILLFLAVVLWALGYSGSGQLEKVSAFIEMAYAQLQAFLHQCCFSLDGKFGWNGYEIENFVVEKMAVIMENVQVQVIPQVLSSSYSCFKGIFEVVAFLFITLLAAVLLEKDYASFLAWLKTSKDLTFVYKAFEGILNYIVTFIKAQGIILLLISVLASAVLWATGIYGGVFWGILAGCLDVLPFIGTGIVLVPMAIWQFLTGKYIQMGVCIALYIACIVIREFLEPKLIGNKMGIAPVLMLLGIYAGIRLFGVAGIIEGPLALIVIHELMKI
ncbi:MAG: AI-2E family transporter [Roseburia sp.]|nr:AI-2E family transporter [Roseburia sp.]MCM1242666.1 AI-2E family transporter [Roseburia sp.]